MAYLNPSPKVQFFDSNGDPLVGGKLYTYAAGTTTPLSTYADQGQSSTNTNPVILDSRGEANVWLGTTGLYKFVLTSSTGSTIWTVDNIGYQYLSPNDLYNQGTETDIASASTVNIGAENTCFLRVTGTTTITSFGTTYKGPRYLRFAGALTLTHNASTLILPTGANITTAAGDYALVVPKATTGTADGWAVAVYQKANGQALVGATDYLNTTRIDVASAATVDLTTNAPNTRNINITGTTTITAFTVAVGQLYFVRFNAALTLTNNASIVTQTGANITTAAGDTCIIRATAANTVEVLCYVVAANISTASSSPAVRQTVLSGPVDSNGLAAFGGSTGSTTVTASGTLTVTAAYGNLNRTGSITNPSWTGLNTNGTMFLYLAVNADGTCTAGSTSLAPVYQWGGTYSTTNNQYTFNIQEMTMKGGDGATAIQVYRLFVGEVTVAGNVVTAITWYQPMGRYFAQGSTGTVPTTTRYSASHNIGVKPHQVRITMVCITGEGGYTAGDEFEIQGMTDASNNNVVTFGADTRLVMGVTASSAATYIWNKTTGALFAFTAGNWAMRFYANRGW